MREIWIELKVFRGEGRGRDGTEESSGRVKKNRYKKSSDVKTNPSCTHEPGPRRRVLTTCRHVTREYLKTINQRMAYTREVLFFREKYDGIVSVSVCAKF